MSHETGTKDERGDRASYGKRLAHWMATRYHRYGRVATVEPPGPGGMG
jgi:hypothetical protein